MTLILLGALHQEINVRSMENLAWYLKRCNCGNQEIKNHCYLCTTTSSTCRFSTTFFADLLLHSSIQKIGWWSSFGWRKSVSPWDAALLLYPSLPAAGATRARCCVAPPPSVPLSLFQENGAQRGGWQTPLPPLTDGFGRPDSSPALFQPPAQDVDLMEGGWPWTGPYAFVLGKIWQGGVSAYLCISVYSMLLCVCVFVCVCVYVSFHLAQTAYIHHALALWQRVGLRQLH